MNLRKTPWTAALLVAAALAAFAGAPSAWAARSTLTPAMHSPIADRSPMLALAQAGRRMIAAGSHGLVLLSDDYGISWRQARDVPTQAMLTAIYFLNDRDGFAVGQDGVILETHDAGETWALRYVDINRGLPLFAIHFVDDKRGIAVGALGLVLETTNGGRNWAERLLRRLDYSDLNLNRIIEADGRIAVASQFGVVYRSTNGGASFEPVQSPSQADFWSALALPDGQMMFGTANGELWRVRSDLTGWTQLDTGMNNGITTLALTLDGRLAVGGLGGYLAVGSPRNDDLKRIGQPEALSAFEPAALIAGPRGILVMAGAKGIDLADDR